MKTTITTLLATICVSGLLFTATAQPDIEGPPDAPPGAGGGGPPDEMQAAVSDTGVMSATPTSVTVSAAAAAAAAQSQAVTSTVILPKSGEPQTVAAAFPPPAQAVGTNASANDLDLNFKNAPLDMVLNYLSDAAGFVIVLDTRVSGYITVTGKHLTQDEAVNLLNTELNKNGYAAIRDERILTIVSKNDAKTRNIPVKVGNDPKSIPNNDEIATWIVPVRFVEARQLVSDLSLFVSAQATIVANEAGNSIVVTDTQSNIRHLAEIIQAVDSSAETETEIRVFTLKYASPVDVASELASVFPSSSGSSSSSQAPIQFGGGRFGGPGGGGPGGFFSRMNAGATSTTASTTQQRLQKASQVTAVADSRIQAVIVSAPKNLMSEIADMMSSLDVASERDQTVATIQLQNGDPQQVAQVLQTMFGSSSTSRGTSSSTSSSSSSALQTRANNSATSMGQTSTTSSSSSSSIGGSSRSGSSF